MSVHAVVAHPNSTVQYRLVTSSSVMSGFSVDRHSGIVTTANALDQSATYTVRSGCFFGVFCLIFFLGGGQKDTIAPVFLLGVSPPRPSRDRRLCSTGVACHSIVRITSSSAAVTFIERRQVAFK